MLPPYQKQIDDIQKNISQLIYEVVEAHSIALQAYTTKNITLFDDVKGVLKGIEVEANDIDNKIVNTLALFGPEDQELRLLITYLKMTNEIIRIGEGAKKYACRMKAHLESDCNLDSLSDMIITLHSSSIAALKFISECFNDHSLCDYENLYLCVMVEESKCDDLYSILEKEILSRIIIEHELSIEYMKVLNTLRKLERASDHAINIAKLMLYPKEGGSIQSY